MPWGTVAVNDNRDLSIQSLIAKEEKYIKELEKRSRGISKAGQLAPGQLPPGVSRNYATDHRWIDSVLAKTVHAKDLDIVTSFLYSVKDDKTPYKTSNVYDHHYPVDDLVGDTDGSRRIPTGAHRRNAKYYTDILKQTANRIGALNRPVTVTHKNKPYILKKNSPASSVEPIIQDVFSPIFKEHRKLWNKNETRNYKDYGEPTGNFGGLIDSSFGFRKYIKDTFEHRRRLLSRQTQAIKAWAKRRNYRSHVVNTLPNAYNLALDMIPFSNNGIKYGKIPLGIFSTDKRSFINNFNKIFPDINKSISEHNEIKNEIDLIKRWRNDHAHSKSVKAFSNLIIGDLQLKNKYNPKNYQDTIFSFLHTDGGLKGLSDVYRMFLGQNYGDYSESLGSVEYFIRNLLGDNNIGPSGGGIIPFSGGGGSITSGGGSGSSGPPNNPYRMRIRRRKRGSSISGQPTHSISGQRQPVTFGTVLKRVGQSVYLDTKNTIEDLVYNFIDDNKEGFQQFGINIRKDGPGIAKRTAQNIGESIKNFRLPTSQTIGQTLENLYFRDINLGSSGSTSLSDLHADFMEAGQAFKSFDIIGGLNVAGDSNVLHRLETASVQAFTNTLPIIVKAKLKALQHGIHIAKVAATAAGTATLPATWGTPLAPLIMGGMGTLNTLDAVAPQITKVGWWIDEGVRKNVMEPLYGFDNRKIARGGAASGLAFGAGGIGSNALNTDVIINHLTGNALQYGASGVTKGLTWLPEKILSATGHAGLAESIGGWSGNVATHLSGSTTIQQFGDNLAAFLSNPGAIGEIVSKGPAVGGGLLLGLLATSALARVNSARHGNPIKWHKNANLDLGDVSGLVQNIPNLPGPPLAEGGVATKATWRMFGEAGPEAVLPLSGKVLGELGKQIVSAFYDTASRSSKAMFGKDWAYKTTDKGFVYTFGKELARVLEPITNTLKFVVTAFKDAPIQQIGESIGNITEEFRKAFLPAIHETRYYLAYVRRYVERGFKRDFVVLRKGFETARSRIDKEFQGLKNRFDNPFFVSLRENLTNTFNEARERAPGFIQGARNLSDRFIAQPFSRFVDSVAEFEYLFKDYIAQERKIINRVGIRDIDRTSPRNAARKFAEDFQYYISPGSSLREYLLNLSILGTEVIPDMIKAGKYFVVSSFSSADTAGGVFNDFKTAVGTQFRDFTKSTKNLYNQYSKRNQEIGAAFGGQFRTNALFDILLKPAALTTAKAIPLLGLLAGPLLAGQRFADRDYTGAKLELAAGLAGGLGLGPASLLFSGLQMRRDYDVRKGLSEIFRGLNRKDAFKTGAKAIPGLGIGAGLLFGTTALARGDGTGALLELLSGIAGGSGNLPLSLALSGIPRGERGAGGVFGAADNLLKGKFGEKYKQNIAKAAARSGLKSIPYIGAGFGTLFAIQKLMQGDRVGAALEFASGLPSLAALPGGLLDGVVPFITTGADAMINAVTEAAPFRNIINPVLNMFAESGGFGSWMLQTIQPILDFTGVTKLGAAIGDFSSFFTDMTGKVLKVPGFGAVSSFLSSTDSLVTGIIDKVGSWSAYAGDMIFRKGATGILEFVSNINPNLASGFVNLAQGLRPMAEVFNILGAGPIANIWLGLRNVFGRGGENTSVERMRSPFRGIRDLRNLRFNIFDKELDDASETPISRKQMIQDTVKAMFGSIGRSFGNFKNFINLDVRDFAFGIAKDIANLDVRDFAFGAPILVESFFRKTFGKGFGIAKDIANLDVRDFAFGKGFGIAKDIANLDVRDFASGAPIAIENLIRHLGKRETYLDKVNFDFGGKNVFGVTGAYGDLRSVDEWMNDYAQSEGASTDKKWATGTKATGTKATQRFFNKLNAMAKRRKFTRAVRNRFLKPAGKKLQSWFTDPEYVGSGSLGSLQGLPIGAPFDFMSAFGRFARGDIKGGLMEADKGLARIAGGNEFAAHVAKQLAEHDKSRRGKVTGGFGDDVHVESGKGDDKNYVVGANGEITVNNNQLELDYSGKPKQLDLDLTKGIPKDKTGSGDVSGDGSGILGAAAGAAGGGWGASLLRKIGLGKKGATGVKVTTTGGKIAKGVGIGSKLGIGSNLLKAGIGAKVGGGLAKAGPYGWLALGAIELAFQSRNLINATGLVGEGISLWYDELTMQTDQEKEEVRRRKKELKTGWKEYHKATWRDSFIVNYIFKPIANIFDKIYESIPKWLFPKVSPNEFTDNQVEYWEKHNERLKGSRKFWAPRQMNPGKGRKEMRRRRKGKWDLLRSYGQGDDPIGDYDVFGNEEPDSIQYRHSSPTKWMGDLIFGAGAAQAADLSNPQFGTFDANKNPFVKAVDGLKKIFQPFVDWWNWFKNKIRIIKPPQDPPSNPVGPGRQLVEGVGAAINLVFGAGEAQAAEIMTNQSAGAANPKWHDWMSAPKSNRNWLQKLWAWGDKKSKPLQHQLGFNRTPVEDVFTPSSGIYSGLKLGSVDDPFIMSNDSNLGNNSGYDIDERNFIPVLKKLGLSHDPNALHNLETEARITGLFEHWGKDLSDDMYRTAFTGKILDESDVLKGHPGIHRNAIWTDGKIRSAAVGMYQFMPDAWRSVSRFLSNGASDNLPMTKANQDAGYAYLLLHKRGSWVDNQGNENYDDATHLLNTGNYTSKHREKVGFEWASFPGSPYGQTKIPHATEVKLRKKIRKQNLRTPRYNTSIKSFWDGVKSENIEYGVSTGGPPIVIAPNTNNVVSGNNGGTRQSEVHFAPTSSDLGVSYYLESSELMKLD